MADEKNEIKVRKMTGADLPKANLVDSSLEGQRRVTTWPFSFENYWRIFEPSIAYCAELNGELVGFIAGTIKEEERSHSLISMTRNMGAAGNSAGKVGWIEIMGVHADRWGKGIGVALMTAFTDECKKQGVAMRINVSDDDDNLKNFLINQKFETSETVTYGKTP
ncbi:GNAT family N-acetyltransferase [Chloroflexota bacterium]